MTAPANERGWGWPGAPGSAQDRAYQRDYIVTITLACGVKLRVRREVGHIFKGFWDELEAETGYSLADRGAPDDWGFNNRDVRGRPGVKSNHAWGLATDGNAEENPMQSPLKTDMPVADVRRLCKRWGLTWGGDYSGRKDSMHTEFLGTPADATRYPLGGARRPTPVATKTPPAKRRLQEAEMMDRPATLRPGGNDGKGTHECWDVFAAAEGALWQLDADSKARLHSILVIAPTKPPMAGGKMIPVKVTVFWQTSVQDVEVHWPGAYLPVPAGGFIAVVDNDDVGLRVFVEQAAIPKAT